MREPRSLRDFRRAERICSMTRRKLVFSAGHGALLAIGLAMILPAHSWADKTDSPDNRLKDKSASATKPERKTIASTKKKKKKLIT